MQKLPSDRVKTSHFWECCALELGMMWDCYGFDFYVVTGKPPEDLVASTSPCVKERLASILLLAVLNWAVLTTCTW